MDLSRFFLVVRQQRVLILSAAIVGALFGLLIGVIRPPTYSAQGSMYVSSQNDSTSQSAYQGSLLSQDRVTSYVELLNSQRIAQEVIKKLSLPETVEELQQELRASSSPDSVVLNVEVSSTSPEKSALIANTVGEIFPPLVAQLERPTDPRLPDPVIVRVVQPAVIPAERSSIGPAALTVVGLLAGLILGLSAALLRNSLDTTLRTDEQLASLTDAPLIGRISKDDEAQADRPVWESGRNAEEFRRVRTNLRFLGATSRSKVFVVTSSMPGEGKTTVSCNLAFSLATAGYRVLLVDGDLRRPQIAQAVGLNGEVGLTNVLIGQASFEVCRQKWSGVVDVLASGPTPPNPAELLGSQLMVSLIEQVRARYEYIIIDSPPLLSVSDTSSLASVLDGALFVARIKAVTRAQVSESLKTLDVVNVPTLGTIVTFVSNSSAPAYSDYGLYQSEAKNSALSADLDPITAAGPNLRDSAGDSRAVAQQDQRRPPAPRPR